MPGIFAAWGAREYIPTQTDATSPYISPLHHPFSTETSLWVCVGGLEVLRDDGVMFADSMKAAGNTVMLHVEPWASHSFLSAGLVTGFQKEADYAGKVAAEWVRECGEKRIAVDD